MKETIVQGKTILNFIKQCTDNIAEKFPDYVIDVRQGKLFFIAEDRKPPIKDLLFVGEYKDGRLPLELTRDGVKLKHFNLTELTNFLQLFVDTWSETEE